MSAIAVLEGAKPMTPETSEDQKSDTPIADPKKAKSSLLPRVLSALVLAPLVIGLIWYGDWPFSVLIAGAALILASEWRGLVFGEQGGRVEQALMSAASLSGIGAVQFGMELIGITLAASFMMLALTYVTWKKIPLTRIALGFPYIVLPAMVLVWLRADVEWGAAAIVWLFVTIWATDSFAYFAGKTFGGPKLAPVLSPNKTWAGLIGGSIGAALFGAACALYLGSAPVILLATLSAVLAVISQAGDITQSSLKRQAGVKDSGNIIPGHGGLLDRVDGLLFAAVAAAIIALLHHLGVENPAASLLVWP
ncbi:MAG: phosphatidate cytidylyltransferase [Parvibaculaceae bacterium]|nr:phosphatidate cytidylyltransferase [Parvibaculaceae bacterium]